MEKQDLFNQISAEFKDHELKQNIIEHIRNGSKRLRLWFLVQLILIENAFSGLYKLFSGKARNKPVDPKILVMIILIKEILGFKTDQAVLDSLKTDSELQQIVGIENADEVPCRRTVIRFRKRLEKHYRKTGENLIEKEIVSLMDAFKLNRQKNGLTVLRIDSTNIEAFLKKTTRLELIYTTVAALVKQMDKKSLKVPKSLRHYLNSREYNRWFYHKKRRKGQSKKQARKNNRKKYKKHVRKLLADIQTLIDLDQKSLEPLLFYDVFVRMAEEQTYLSERGKRRLKNESALHSRTLQSPFDPDATYRRKNNQDHVGYVINFVEIVTLDENNKISSRNIIYYQIEQNTYSDCRFLKDFLDQYQVQERESYLVADGAYYSYENEVLAKRKNLNLIPTEMTGRETNPFLSEFELSEDGREFISCPGCKKAKTATYNEKTEQIYLSFPIQVCQNCPHRDKCRPEFKKRVARQTISKKSVARAKMQKSMRSDDLAFLSDIRNGVESIPSQLKNTYNINKMRRRGLFYAQLDGALKIFALSLTKITATWLKECYNSKLGFM